MLEGVLALARQPAARRRHDQVLAAQRLQGRPQVDGVALVDRALPEGLADDRGRLQDPTFGPRERVEAGGEHRVDRLRQRLGVGGALLDDPVDHLLGEQGVAARSRGDLLGELLAGSGGVPEQRGDQRLRLLARQRLERHRGCVQAPAAPAGTAVEELVAGHADDQDRPPRPARQVLDQVEHALVGPVDVLDRQDHGLATAEGLDQLPDRGEQALAHLLRVVVLAAVRRRIRRRVDSQRAPERGGEPLGGLLHLGPGDQLLDPAVELAPGGVGVVGVGDVEAAADDLRRAPSTRAPRRRRDSRRGGWPAAGHGRR